MTPIGVAFIVGQLRMGGAQRQLLYLTQGLDRSRFAPVLLSLPDGDPVTPLFRDAGVETVELAYRGRHDVGIVARIRRELRRRQIAVACPCLWPATLWGYLGLRWAGVSRWIASERSSAATFDSPLAIALESRILARAPLLVAISDASRKFAIARGVRPERIRVIPIGVPTPRPAVSGARVRAELGIGPDDPVIGCVARFGPQKDHRTLLGAAALVGERLPQLHVVLVGDGVLRPRLEALTAELGLDRVHFVGLQLNPADYLNIFDVAVLSSNREEGFSNFVIEAGLLAKPVVATRIGGIPEAVKDGETGCLVPPEDPPAMAEAITSLLRDPVHAASLGARAAGWAKRFEVSTMVRAWEEVLGA
ncbi:MAG TPA: glycosyltransferase [Gemmatimonadales bacterium]|nr:glycosyltransferase [Gemmatimonadales bacterium]